MFYPYYQWEDFKFGMWRKCSSHEEREFLSKAISFTGNHIEYGMAMRRVIKEWPVACYQNLTDLNLNRRAFIGHAACCLEFGCPEYITRMAWAELTDTQRLLANKEADIAIQLWFENQIPNTFTPNLFYAKN